MSSARSVRSTQQWRRVRQRVIERDRAAGVVCGVCQRPIDWNAPARSRWSASVDHIVALVSGGDPYAMWNLRTLHYRCNSSTGGRLGQARRARAKAVPTVWSLAEALDPEDRARLARSRSW